MITGMASLDDQCRQEQQDELAGLQAIFGDHACACDVQTGELKASHAANDVCTLLPGTCHSCFHPPLLHVLTLLAGVLAGDSPRS